MAHFHSFVFPTQIVWPEEWNEGHPDLHSEDTPIFLISVDGVHCRINEPIHPFYAKNPKYYSHKFKNPGLTYELGVSIFHNSLVWMKGPDKASVHDITVFRDELKDKIPNGKKAIADKAYRGEKEKVSAPNPRDPKELRRFKSRARARHESFNARLKAFQCLDDRFRHGKDKHQICFEAVAVICQYQLENGSPLFDV